MGTCEHCGREAGEERTSSNTEREILIRVPERHFFLMHKTFKEMETKLGMYGYGELANTLKPYQEPFRQNFEVFRYFDDGALAMASIGVTWGYRGTVDIGKADARGRHPVHIDFTGGDGKTRRMQMSDCATPEAAEHFTEWFMDMQDRLSPAPDESPEPKA